jgi:hypothetical protein
MSNNHSRAQVRAPTCQGDRRTPTGVRPTEKIGGDRGSGGAHGERKPQMGYRRMQGVMPNPDHEVGRGTVAEMSARQGMEPGARAGTEEHLEGVPRATPGPDRGRRFFHRRSPDPTLVCHPVPSPVLPHAKSLQWVRCGRDASLGSVRTSCASASLG